MARKNPQTLKGRIAGATGSYRGNTGTHNIGARGNQFANHKTNYRNVRKSFGMSAG